MDFNLVNYWESRYLAGKTSGEGSYGKEAQDKASHVNRWIKQTGARKIVEIGCGDGNNLKLYKGFKEYYGYDISETAVSFCKRIFPYNFTSNKKDLPRADLCLCLDVLFHQVNDNDYYQTLELLFARRNRYVLIYSTSHTNNEGLARHMRNRDFRKDVRELYPSYTLINLEPGYHQKYIAVYGAC